MNDLLPLALACFLLGAVETAAIGRMFAAKHGGRLDANQEFLALAAANLAAALGRGFPVSGGMSQSAVNEGGGARTPVSGIIAAAVILVVVLFFSHLLRALPQPVLAAVVLVAVSGLFKLSTLKQLWAPIAANSWWRWRPFLGVLGSGLLRGVLIGAVISLAQLLRRASRPHVASLGRIPGTRRFSDRERHPDNEPVPGVLIFRPESGLVYFNVDHVCDLILDRTRAERHAAQARRAGPFRRALRWTCKVRTRSRASPTNSPPPASAPGRRSAFLGARAAAPRGRGRESSAGSIASPPWPTRWRQAKAVRPQARPMTFGFDRA